MKVKVEAKVERIESPLGLILNLSLSLSLRAVLTARMKRFMIAGLRSGASR